MKGTSQHLDRIDVLRALAILGVFLYHGWNGLWPQLKAQLGGCYWLSLPFQWGWCGVSLFFVISGFCIHYSYLKDRSKRIEADDDTGFTRRFLWKRFWRIYPAYLVALAFSIFAAYREHKVTGTDVWLHTLLLHNFNSATFYSLTAAFWSLAVEWQFYLMYPAIVLLRSRVGINRAFWAVAGLSLVSRLVAARLQDWQAAPSATLWHFPTILFFDWMLGAVLAENWASGKKVPGLARLWPVWLLCVVGSTIPAPTRCLTFSLASLFFASVMEPYLNSTRPLLRVERFVIPLGVCSYSFYLWHQLLTGYLLGYFHRFGLPDLPWLNFCLVPTVVFALIFLFSWVLYKTIEMPTAHFGHHLARRFQKRPASGLQAKPIVT